MLSSVLDSAVEDRLITANPCKGKSIKRPTSASPNIVVWPDEQLRAVREGLAKRFQIVCAIGAGCGLRQGEILGLSLDDADETGTTLYVRRQIRVVGGTLVFALPKGRKLAEYLGHADPGFTLRTYTHLMPSSHERARAAIDGVFADRKSQGPTRAPEVVTGPLGTQS